MFKWLHQEAQSELVEHAKLRQQQRKSALCRRDPLEEVEVLDPAGVQVKEISAEEFAELMRRSQTGAPRS